MKVTKEREMGEREIIADRLMLLGDILKYAPEMAEPLLNTLDKNETKTLLGALDALTDKAEELFTGKQAAQQREYPQITVPELGEREILCRECELGCVVRWDESGAVSGAKCQMGMQLGRRAMEAEKAEK